MSQPEVGSTKGKKVMNIFRFGRFSKTLSVVYMMQDHVRTNAPKPKVYHICKSCRKRFLNLSGVCSFEDKEDIHFGRF